MKLWSCDTCRVVADKPKQFKIFSRFELENIFRKIEHDVPHELYSRRVVFVGYGPSPQDPKAVMPLFVDSESEHVRALEARVGTAECVAFCYVCSCPRIFDEIPQ